MLGSLQLGRVGFLPAARLRDHRASFQDQLRKLPTQLSCIQLEDVDQEAAPQPPPVESIFVQSYLKKEKANELSLKLS